MKDIVSVEEIYRAKSERRKLLANLPIEEKVKMIEKLHELGLTMRAARARLVRATNGDVKS
jgi:hypothetical protein